MDLLGSNPVLDLGDHNFRIYSRNQSGGPQFVGENAKVVNSYVTDGCEIYGTVINSVLGAGVKVMPGAYVKDCVLMGDSVIEAGANVNYSIIDIGVIVGTGASIGESRESAKGIAVLGQNIEVPAGYSIAAGEIISEI
jgi:glucose-1-phosphate adenylyltransferase